MEDVEHVGRLVFALSLKQIRNLPLVRTAAATAGRESRATELPGKSVAENQLLNHNFKQEVWSGLMHFLAWGNFVCQNISW